MHQFVTFTTATPLQHGIADFLSNCPEHHENLGAFYQAKRDLFCDLLSDSRFRLTRSAGTFFQLVDYRQISNEPDTELARRWTVERKVASIPISVFYEGSTTAELSAVLFREGRCDAQAGRGDPMRALNVALVQVATHWHDPAANRDLFDAMFAEVEPATDLIVLPEMLSTGFTMASREVAETMEGDTVAWLRRQAAERQVAIAGSVVIHDAGRYFNRLVWMPPDGRETVYRQAASVPHGRRT